MISGTARVKRFRSGGIAAWSIHRPIAVTMLALAIVVPGLLSVGRLHVDLLPELIYPTIRVRIVDDGIPARIMEDQVTRQLEEQLAITEGAVSVESFTREGRSSVDLSFPYGFDIDTALRDASTRLDHAKRFLPDTIDPPIIYKLDPSQSPVLELVVSSFRRDPTALSEWADYAFSKALINLPGVAAVEVGGGRTREITIEVDQERLAAAGLNFTEVSDLIAAENRDAAGGRMELSNRELATRVAGRFTLISELQQLPLRSDDRDMDTGLTLSDVARIYAGHSVDELRVRVNGVPGVKLSIQKQPQANTVAVVDTVLNHIAWMDAQGLIPEDIAVKRVNDQAVFIRHALRNAVYAALSGALLAMSVVYLFLGNLRRTLIVGTAIPLAILVTFMLMHTGGLTLNIMTLGGLALGIGILVDSTIVMLENIYRHQSLGHTTLEDATRAAAQVNSPIVASTTTNLAAIVPFLFVGGLVGLIFRELIFTISAAIAASMVVALTLVPALAARVYTPAPGRFRRRVDTALERAQSAYRRTTQFLLHRPWLPFVILVPALIGAAHYFLETEQIFLPPVDEGRVRIHIKGDSGMQLEEMDKTVRKIEDLLAQRPEVETLYTQAGGFVYGRTQWMSGNRSTLSVQLISPERREMTTDEWVEDLRETLWKLDLPGFNIRIWAQNRVRGIKLGRGTESVSLRIAGPDLQALSRLGDEAVALLRNMDELDNLRHSYEDVEEELEVVIDRKRAADLGVDAEDIGRALRVAVEGIIISDYVDGDQRIDMRLRLPERDFASRENLSDIIVTTRNGQPVRLQDLAKIRLKPAPATIMRDKQVRVVEVSASVQEGEALDAVMREVKKRLARLELPRGYTLYDDGAAKALKEGQRTGNLLLALAIFLVFVVMAVQYESLRNPLVILLSIPFALIGVAAGLWYNALALSMPVWLGMIMLAGIVVNNAIVLVEQIEIEREKGLVLYSAITAAAGHRLRPILMTALTTVTGMIPLALGLGEGSEMLQPLAVVIVWGLSFSTLVSLVVVPAIYSMVQIPSRMKSTAQTT